MGPHHTLLVLDADAHARAARTHHLARQLEAHLGADAVVPGAGSVLVNAPLDALATWDAAPWSADGPDAPAAVVDIPTVYDGEDLASVAAAAGLTVQGAVALHSERVHTVELLGFQPGFAYLVGLPRELQLPRRPQPRARVPALSVAVAGEHSGIYPSATPGGWHLLGRAVGVRLFDVLRTPPALLTVGTHVRFVPVGEPSPGEAARSSEAGVDDLTPLNAKLRVIRSLGCVTVQDLGRPGGPRLGVPPGGAMDRGLLRACNAALGQAAGTPGLEVFLGQLTLEALQACRVAVDGRVHALGAGDTLTVNAEPPRACRCVALEGGVAVPLLLGSASTLLSCGLGGHHGRPLRRGDVLCAGGAAPSPLHMGLPTPDARPTDSTPLRVWPGPHGDRFGTDVWDVLGATRWEVSSTLNRVGTRLAGGALPRAGKDSALPVPMVRGAVQVTSDGTPVVLGPEHPVTGGYPVLGVMDPQDQDRFAQLRPGMTVRLQRA